MRFHDRADAGRKLAASLSHYKAQRPVVLALPRGGVPVAAEVARALEAPLDVLLVRKIGVPYQPELAMGAVVDGSKPVVVRNEEIIQLTGTAEAKFQEVCEGELAEIERRRRAFLGTRPPLDPAGRVAIVIDDGIATGATMRAALRATRMRGPKKLVLAVPVAPTDTLKELSGEVDENVCLTSLEPFGAVGFFYADFGQLTDEEVREILGRFPHEAPSGNGSGEPLDAADIKRLTGEIDDATITEILKLEPSTAEVQQAALWAKGDGDLLGQSGHKLAGKAAAVFEILSAHQEDDEYLR